MVKAALSKEQVEHVAKLANLPISSKEISKFAGQLSEVVDYISVISKAEDGKWKVDGGLKNIGRKDEVKSERCLSQEGATSGTKDKHNGLFVIPAIFE